MTNSNDSLRPELQAVLDKLQAVYDSCEEGSDGFCSKTLDTASDLIHKLPDGIPAPEIIHEPKLCVNFQWQKDDKNKILVMISFDNMLYYKALVRNVAFNGSLKSGGAWPVSVIEIVESMFE